jgi:hypothetical protein
MEETEIKNLRWSGLQKRSGDIAVPSMGIMALFLVVLRFLRTNDDVVRMGLGSIALCVVGIATIYYKLTRDIGRLRGKIDEKSLYAFYGSAAGSAQIAYLICVMALGVASHR